MKKMIAEDFVIAQPTGKKFDEAVVSVLKSVEKNGWALFAVYDVKERLAAKGFEHPPLKIVEICSAKHASRFLGKNKLSSLCMPCKIIVLEENGVVKIVGMRPSAVSMFFPQITGEDAMEAENEVKRIIDGAK